MPGGEAFASPPANTQLLESFFKNKNKTKQKQTRLESGNFFTIIIEDHFNYIYYFTLIYHTYFTCNFFK
jgi:hypothetical protein